MREIKFRVWDYKNKVMVVNFPYDNLKVEHFYSRCEVMQYTGLKDKNGKEIYEGDIISDDDWGSDEENPSIAEIRWVEGGFWCIEKISGEFFENGDLRHWQKERIEVIGNIYENPELLK